METGLYGLLSMITPLGYSNNQTCGYCHGESMYSNRNRFAYYASTSGMSPSFYKSLLDRCWRRSGSLLYRPNQRDSCCPHYTVRLDSAAFHATKDQRQTVNRFNRYVIGDAYAAEAVFTCPRSRKEAKQRDASFDLAKRIHEPESHMLPPLARRSASHSNKKAEADTKEPIAAESSKLAEPGEPTRPGDPVKPAHRFEVTLEPDTFTEEKYLVFENYQRLVHKEPPSKISRASFRSFLCDSPLRRETVVINNRAREFGSFHQCYRLDGRLVAIGVLDLLPQCVSAVYFLYHESIHQYSPGKLGAMREITLALEGGYKWWYSGYYIHSCPKMRYKGDFAPQYILDPDTLDWDLLDKAVLALFDQKPYVSLSQERRQRALPDSASVGDGGSGDGRGSKSNALDDDGDVKKHDNGNQSSSSDDDGNFPLLTSNMPGLPPTQALERFNFELLPVALRGPNEIWFPITRLPAWTAESATVLDGESLKGKIAELIAMIGIDLMSQVCVDFR